MNSETHPQEYFYPAFLALGKQEPSLASQMLDGNCASSTWTETMTFWLTYATKTQTLILSASKTPSEWEAEQWRRMGYQQRSLTPTRCSTDGATKLPKEASGEIWEHPENGDQIISLCLTVSQDFQPHAGIAPSYLLDQAQQAINAAYTKLQQTNSSHSYGGSQIPGINTISSVFPTLNL